MENYVGSNSGLLTTFYLIQKNFWTLTPGIPRILPQSLLKKVISMKSCTSVWIMPDVCKHRFEAKVGEMRKFWWGGKAPSETISIFTHKPSNLCLHISGIIRILVQLFIKNTIFKWIFEVELLEFLVSTFEISTEQSSSQKSRIWSETQCCT